MNNGKPYKQKYVSDNKKSDFKSTTKTNNSTKQVNFYIEQGNDILDTGSLDTFMIERAVSQQVGKYKQALSIKSSQAKKLTMMKGEFMFIYQHAMLQLAKGNYKESDFRVFSYIVSQIDYGIDGYINQTHEEIANELQMARETVTKSIGKLHKEGFISKIKSGTRVYLTISSDVGFKGRLNSAFKKSEREEEEKRLKIEIKPV